MGTTKCIVIFTGFKHLRSWLVLHKEPLKYKQIKHIQFIFEAFFAFKKIILRFYEFYEFIKLSVKSIAFRLPNKNLIVQHVFV